MRLYPGHMRKASGSLIDQCQGIPFATEVQDLEFDFFSVMFDPDLCRGAPQTKRGASIIQSPQSEVGGSGGSYGSYQNQ